MAERRRRSRYRLTTPLACALVAALLTALARPPVAADGVVLDLLVKARALVFPVKDDAAASPVAVIAVDPLSFESKVLAPYPRTLMGPFWAETIDAVVGSGARAIGFDLIFSYNAGQLASLGLTAFENYDQPFLRALNEHRRQLVLGRSASHMPARPYFGALDNDDDAVGMTELSADPDGVYRTVPPAHDTEEEGRKPGLAAAVLARAGSPMSGPVVLAPRRHLESIPTYSLAAVHECARQAPAALAAAFKGKIVLVGTTFPEEDRKLSPGRFLRPEPTPPRALHDCGLRRLGASTPGSLTVPGVFLHAAAIEAVETGHVVGVAPPFAMAVLAAVVAALAAMIGLACPPWGATGLTIALAAALAAAGTAALARDLWLPLALPLAAVVASPVVAYVVRYVVEDRKRRLIENAFGHYLSPAVVGRLAEDPSALALGGKTSQVTVMFADLSGFTALSGTVSADVLTKLTNEYLAYIVEQVEATGGYVDKFIGDAVMALWGAPAADADHAAHAIESAHAAVRRISEARDRALARGERAFSVKIGLNSGPAVVGNVGTEKRYNYTAVGETVNVASRLESVPGIYGAAVVVGPVTAELARAHVLFRELDWIKVKGREKPLAVFEPLALAARATAEQREHARRYEEALAQYRAMRFADAQASWLQLAESADASLAGPPRIMAERAATFVKEPPPVPWDGVWVLTGK